MNVFPRLLKTLLACAWNGSLLYSPVAHRRLLFFFLVLFVYRDRVELRGNSELTEWSSCYFHKILNRKCRGDYLFPITPQARQMTLWEDWGRVRSRMARALVFPHAYFWLFISWLKHHCYSEVEMNLYGTSLVLKHHGTNLAIKY